LRSFAAFDLRRFSFWPDFGSERYEDYDSVVEPFGFVWVGWFS